MSDTMSDDSQVRNRFPGSANENGGVRTPEWTTEDPDGEARRSSDAGNSSGSDDADVKRNRTLRRTLSDRVNYEEKVSVSKMYTYVTSSANKDLIAEQIS